MAIPNHEISVAFGPYVVTGETADEIATKIASIEADIIASLATVTTPDDWRLESTSHPTWPNGPRLGALVTIHADSLEDHMTVIP